MEKLCSQPNEDFKSSNFQCFYFFLKDVWFRSKARARGKGGNPKRVSSDLNQRNPHCWIGSTLGLGTTISLSGQGPRPSAREILLAITRMNLDHIEGSEIEMGLFLSTAGFQNGLSGLHRFFQTSHCIFKVPVACLIIEVTA